MAYSVWKSCKDCKYCDENRNPTKVSGDGSFKHYGYDYDRYWCSKRGEYVHKTSASEFCFEDKPASGCFLTTACTEYKGLPDDCMELTVLRAFRDSYLKNTAEGENLVREYYEIAPKIVERVNGSSKKDEIYEEIYRRIACCIEHIQAGENETAVQVYREMVAYADGAVKA